MNCNHASLLPSVLDSYLRPFLFAFIACLPVSNVWVSSHTLLAQDATEEAPAAEPEQEKKLFPDAALEAAVRAEVYEKRYNDEPLTVDDVKHVSRVVAIGKGIQNLEGLQHCVALRLIRLSNNEIKDVSPLANLKLLQSLDLASNQIADIAPLANLDAIQLLELSGNQISDISVVAKMPNMRSLWLANNQIKSLEPIQGLAKVGSLDLAGNGLEAKHLAPIGKLAWLTHVDLDRNQIDSLEALRPLKKLSMVLARENKITELTALVEMCKQDAESEKRFAPYLELYLQGNSLSSEAKDKQIPTLQEIGVEVILE